MGERELQLLTVFLPFDHDSQNEQKQFWSPIGNELKLKLSIDQMRNSLISASKSCRVQQYTNDNANHYGGLGVRQFEEFLQGENELSFDKFQKFIAAGVVQVARIDLYRQANQLSLLSFGHDGATLALRQRNCVYHFLETTGISSLRNEILQNGQVNLAELNRGAFRRMDAFVLPFPVREFGSVLTDYQAMYRGWAETFFPEPPEEDVGGGGEGGVGGGGGGGGGGSARINGIPRDPAFYLLNDIVGQPWLMATDNRAHVVAHMDDDM